MKKTNGSKLGGAINNSFFLSILNKFSNFIFDKITTSFFARFFTAYDAIDSKLKESYIKQIFCKIKPKTKTIIKLKNKATTSIENSYCYKKYVKLINILLGARARLYGLFLFIYGFFSTGIGLMQKYSLEINGNKSDFWIQGLIVIFFSMPLLMSKEKLGVLLSEGVFSSKIIAFFDVKPDKLIKEEVQDNAVIPVVLALIAGMLTLIITPLIFFGIIFAFLLLLLVLSKPEFGVLGILVFIPFTPTMLICAEIIAVFFSYLIKVLRGKRSFKLDLLDLFVLIFSLFMFLGGAFSVTPSQSLPPACVYFCFISLYFLIVNLVKTTRLASKILSCSVITFFITSLYGVYQNFFGTPDTTWTDEDMFSEIETRVVSTFENPNVFGEYLILLIPVVIMLFLCANNSTKKVSYLLTLASAGAALVYTWSRGAWIGFIVSFLILLVIITKRAISLYALGLISLPIAVPFLPSSILGRITSIGNMTDSSTSYRVFIWEATVDIIKDYFVTGIGVGTGAFQTVYSEYALAGIETAPHSHNLYLQILVEIGIFGFAIFAIAMLLYFSKCFSFIKNSSNNKRKFILGGLLSGVIAFLTQGLTDYVWYNYRVFALFWIIIGISVSYINSAINEDAERKDIFS